MKNDAPGTPTIGWSDFARGRHLVGGKHTWYEGSDEELHRRMLAGWSDRRPGQGRADLTQVVIVPVVPEGFVGATVLVDEQSTLHAHFDRRQHGEDGFIRVTADGTREPTRHAAVVLYSAETLQENGGTRTTDCDWEIVCLLAGPHEAEPMDPLTMARNFLEKTGGTYAKYSAREFAESVWYWSRRASVHR